MRKKQVEGNNNGPNGGSYGDNIWICPYDETANTGEICMVCHRPKPGKRVPPNMRWILIAAAAVLVVIIAWMCGLHIHKWQAATCDQPRTCSICGKTDASALGHKWEAATCTSPKTCSVCGKTQGSALGHDWDAATCTEVKHCSRCGKNEGTALGHNWVEATCTEAKQCTRCGKMEGSALGHDWAAATNKKPKTCRRRGATEGEPTHELELNPVLEYTDDIVRTVTASSIYDGDTRTHEPSNLIDNDLETNWAEGAKGYGIGESLAFQFNKTYALKAITLYNGNQRSESLFKKNGRIKKMTISFPNGYEVSYDLPDLMDPCIIPFDPMFITGSLVITIDSVYEGNTYEDTVISEIGFVGHAVID